MSGDTANARRSFWSRAKTNSKAGFDKVYNQVDKLGPPINRLSHKLGSEAFWPTTLDKESEKAARILRSFCKDGFYQEELFETAEGPKQKQRVVKKIPPEVIQNAKGLAIFTTMRTGLWVSGAGGSGILIGRTEDGSWSPPAGIMLHTAGLGFLIGVDIYDCVLVLNTQEAVNAFAKWRCTVGGELSATAGPVGMGGIFESEVHKRQSPIFSYLKSRGFYAGVQIDGTVIIERTDENERFYRERISATDIVSGKIRHPPYELKILFETLKAAQGDTDVDKDFLPTEPPPADYEVVEEGHTFGVPDKDDPDPFGVLALEKEGMSIKEAGSKIRASTDEFDFNPRLSSPIYASYRRSTDNSSNGGGSPRDSWRKSTLSTLERRYVTSDSATQTDLNPSGTTYTDSPVKSPVEEERDSSSDEDDEKDREINGADSPSRKSTGDDNEADVHEVQQAAAPQIIRAKVVQVPKRIPPKLPPRNPNRSNTSMQTEATEPTRGDVHTPTTELNKEDMQAQTTELSKENNQPRATEPSISQGSEDSGEPLKSISSTDERPENQDEPVSPISSGGRASSFRSVKSEQPSPRPDDVPSADPVDPAPKQLEEEDSELSRTSTPPAASKDQEKDEVHSRSTTPIVLEDTTASSVTPSVLAEQEKPIQSHISLANIRTDLNSDADESDASPVEYRQSKDMTDRL